MIYSFGITQLYSIERGINYETLQIDIENDYTKIFDIIFRKVLEDQNMIAGQLKI